MLKTRILQLAIGALVAVASPAMAEKCDAVQSPSKSGGEPAVIKFFNETGFPVSLYWADIKGHLNKMALMQPDQVAEFKTFSGHYWHMEAHALWDDYCFGPISAEPNESCLVRLLFEGDLGVNAGACEY